MKAKASLLAAVYLLLSGFCFAQSTGGNSKEEKKYIKKANKRWRNAHWVKALQFYQKALDINPKNCYSNFQVGAIYYMSDSAKIKALPYFRNTIKYSPGGKNDTIVDACYYLGYCYMLEEKYDSAAFYFRIYRSHLDNVKVNNSIFNEIDRNLQICAMAPGILRRPADSAACLISGTPQSTFVYDLDCKINSPYPDYSQVLYNHDSTILFTSRRPASQNGKIEEVTGKYYEDTYISRKENNGNWSDPVRLAHQLNLPAKQLHMATVSLTEDGKTLFIYRGGNILQSEKINGKWSEPHEFSTIKLPKKPYIPSIFFSHDGTKLLLAVNAEGGYGGKDIYMCTKDSAGKWSGLQNLGPVINTAEDEDSPFLLPDNKTLFFSSKGHGGLGGYDIFVSHFENGAWSAPVNLGAPINSPADDVFFTYKPEEKKGYFSSARINGCGDMDIYSFNFIVPAPADSIALKSKKAERENEIASLAKVNPAEMPANKKDTLLNPIPPVTENNNLNSSKEETAKEKPITKLAKEETTGNAPNEKETSAASIVYFKFNSHTLSNKYKAYLNSVIKQMNSDKTATLNINGYTDKIGNASYNKRLSMLRAQAVSRYLILHGVDKLRIKLTGWGASNYAAPNDGKHNHLNRRAEILFTK